ncbi:MAG: hypothetical protein IBX50_05405 [Marinospirillum sp.]|uniref:hypothetical protein n=1 Tax=Marinospirillum sp. TaxID=2183934 RepID=UPI0019DD1A0C|nr:hypothetical protein [Marinospirillum sp.]MBE0506143.1 hypothetical protein [Marinospirillum sp.]
MQTNLKTLSRQYANGILTKPEYRKARAELIETSLDNDLTEPQATVPFIADESEPDEDASSENESDNQDAEPPAASAAEKTDKKGSCQRRNQLLMLISLVLLGIVITLAI